MLESDYFRLCLFFCFSHNSLIFNNSFDLVNRNHMIAKVITIRISYISYRWEQKRISWIILLSYVVHGWIKINTEIHDQSVLFICISMIRFRAEFNFIQTYTRLVHNKNEFNYITGKFFSERCLFKLRGAPPAPHRAVTLLYTLSRRSESV